MLPISPVIPGLERHEVVYAKDQPEYLPLPSLRTRDGRVTARWQLTPEEREWIAKGADIFITLLTFNGPLAPHSVQVINVDPENPNYSAKATAGALGLEELLAAETQGSVLSERRPLVPLEDIGREFAKVLAGQLRDVPHARHSGEPLSGEARNCGVSVLITEQEARGSLDQRMVERFLVRAATVLSNSMAGIAKGGKIAVLEPEPRQQVPEGEEQLIISPPEFPDLVIFAGRWYEPAKDGWMVRLLLRVAPLA